MEEPALIKESSLPTVDILVTALIPNENNTNQMSDNELARLIKEIQDEGFMVPLNVIPLPENKFLILGGEHRWKASKVLGMSYVPCIIHKAEKWTDMDNVDLETFKLNAIKGKINQEKFLQLYRRLCDNPNIGAEKVQEALGVTSSDEWKKLTRDIRQSLKDQNASQDVLNDVEKAEKSAKSPDELSKKLSKILKKHSESFRSNAIVIQDEKGESVLVKASENVFRMFKILVESAQAKGQDINQLLAPALDKILQE